MNPNEAPRVQLPERTVINLTGRATTAIYDSGPPANAPATGPPLVLLHGWCVNSYVNFGSAYDTLAEQRRVIMIDIRGHGFGAETDERFSLQTCADDVLEVLDSLGVSTFTVVGYSLGGALAQLVARMAPDRVTGLVLAATAELFCGHLAVRWQFRGLELSAAAMRRVPGPIKKQLFRHLATIFCLRYPGWVRDEVLLCDPVALLEAGAALGSFNSASWVSELELSLIHI